MPPPPKPHWLYTATRTTSPDVVVTFATTTIRWQEDDATHEILRCWAALTRIRNDAAPRHPRTSLRQGTEAADLVEVVEDATGLTGEAWVFAHNLGVDLVVTALPFTLVERGWHLDSFHLGEEACWFILSRDDRKLVVTDAWSWVRCGLDDVARDLRRRRRSRPDDDDPMAAWHDRARRDAQLLDEAMTTVLDWWDREQLGRWSVTGSGCGWAAMKHHTPPRTILVGPDGDRTAFERRAIHSGRKEAYVVGRIDGTWCADYDFVAAYLTTAAHLPLPLKPTRQRATEGSLTAGLEDPRYDYLAEVEITTRRPCAPARIGDDTWWPVGTFRTVLSGPEVRYVATVADKVEVLLTQWYEMGDALSTWARWCLSLIADKGQHHPAIIGRIAKGWGRSVVGRFAGRTGRVVADRPATRQGWHLETGHDLVTGAALEVITIGGRELTIQKDVDTTDCSPAVFAFVEGYCRTALGKVLDARPAHKLLQCNTDGWWERGAQRRSGPTPVKAPEPYQIARKAIAREVVVIGPNHLVTPAERRLSGIPSNADMDDDGTYHWHDEPSLRWQLEKGTPGTFVRPTHAASMADHYARRWVLESGETLPVTVTVDRDRRNVILGWDEAWGRRPGDVLADVQVDELVPLSGSDPAAAGGPFFDLPRQAGRIR